MPREREEDFVEHGSGCKDLGECEKSGSGVRAMRGRAFRAGDGPFAGFSGLERVADALNDKNNDAQELESAHWLL